MGFTAIDHDLLSDSVYLAFTSAEKAAWIALLIVAGEKSQVCPIGSIPQAWYPKILSGKLGLDHRTVASMLQKAQECGKVRWTDDTIRIECPIYRARLAAVNQHCSNGSGKQRRNKAGATLQQGCSNPAEDSAETRQDSNTTYTHTKTSTHTPPVPPKGEATCVLKNDDLQRYLDQWNAMAEKVGCLQVKSLTPKRQAMIQERQADPDFNYGQILQFITIMRPGFNRTDGSRWQPTFDWVLVSQENYARLLEGQFSNGKVLADKDPKSIDPTIPRGNQPQGFVWNPNEKDTHGKVIGGWVFDRDGDDETHTMKTMVA